MPDPLDTGLALSGGGYRAMLFSLGSVWRLNELGWLRKLDVVTSVSGGSILNGVLATRWSQLEWNAAGVATNFPALVAQPVRAMAGRTLDVFAGLEGLLSIFSTIADKVTEAYDDHLFHGARLQSGIPPFEKGRTPRFLFYATSLQTGSSVRIERKRLADYRIGEIRDPDLPVARVVCASSAFPPVLSPVELRLDPASWRELPGAGLFARSEFRKRMLLTDGGVYDNMGLEAIWDRCSTVLVSDAGAPLDADPDPPTDWTRQAIRVLDIVSEQTRALRRRRLLHDFQQAGEAATSRRNGTYWGIRTRIDDYGMPDALVRDNARTQALQDIRTRLNEFKPAEQGELINWGYALTDAAMRRWVDRQNAAPASWPVPEHALA
jgi:NTE family protein